MKQRSSSEKRLMGKNLLKTIACLPVDKFIKSGCLCKCQAILSQKYIVLEPVVRESDYLLYTSSHYLSTEQEPIISMQVPHPALLLEYLVK